MEKKYLIKEEGSDRLMLTALTKYGALDVLKKLQARYPERKFYVSKRGV